MIARSLARRTVAATLVTALLSFLTLGAAAALALRLLWSQHDADELRRTVDTLDRGLRAERDEGVHSPQEAAAEALRLSLLPGDHGVVRSGDGVLAEQGTPPPRPAGGGTAPGWIDARRVTADGLAVHVARRPEDTSPVERLFWVALVLAAIPSSAVAYAVGRQAGRAAARPIEDLARRLGAVRHPRDYTPGQGDALAAEAAVLEGAFAGVVGRLGAALEREAEFARNAAHELRTPLTRIRLRAERAAAGACDELRGEMTALVAEVDRLARLADALLVLARDESAGLGAGETVNVADLVRTSAAAGTRAVAVEAPDEALVRGDEDLLRLAVDNLLENSRKYAPPGETPSALLRADSSAVTLRVETPGAVLGVEERARLFERFFRGASARATAPGHGLGLALARHVARFHGGEVSAADGGPASTVFELTLPPWQRTA